MLTAKKLTGTVMATAAAALFAGCAHMGGEEAAMEEKAEVAQVKCVGTNSCKGTSECATANSSCKGQNSCAGQGWVYAESADSCTGAGGTVES